MDKGGGKTKSDYIVRAILVVIVIWSINNTCLHKYTILSGSMLPTININDIVYVKSLSFHFGKYNDKKSNMGHNCYSNIDKVKIGDIVLFNFPYSNNDYSVIKMDSSTIYCKRILGTPGDRIGAVDGHYWNDRVLRPIGVIQEQEKLRWMYDSVFIWNNNYDVIPLSTPKWNIKNWGPIIVPCKGVKIELDDFTRELYRQVIEYEIGTSLPDGLDIYSFRNNWFFVVGDNAIDSFDSRYWGFIPEDFLIGIVWVSLSKKSHLIHNCKFNFYE